MFSVQLTGHEIVATTPAYNEDVTGQFLNCSHFLSKDSSSMAAVMAFRRSNRTAP